jgi:hypothetical protein
MAVDQARRPAVPKGTAGWRQPRDNMAVGAACG